MLLYYITKKVELVIVKQESSENYIIIYFTIIIRHFSRAINNRIIVL